MQTFLSMRKTFDEDSPLKTYYDMITSNETLLLPTQQKILVNKKCKNTCQMFNILKTYF